MNKAIKPAAPVTTLPAAKEQLRVVIVGHVDHGKSTLVGRLFHDTGMLPEGKFEAIEEMCRRRGMPFEWVFLMDSLKVERDQGVTIDTSQIWFNHGEREYVLIDADQGVRSQSRHHGYLLQLLGVRQVAVVVNKMDLIGYDEDKFRAIEQEYRNYLEGLGVTPTGVIPISARDGDNITAASDNLARHKGPTVLGALAGFAPPLGNEDAPLRLPLQDVYKFDDRRIFAGRIESGRFKIGDELLFSPSNRTAHVASIEAWNAPAPVTRASAGSSVGFTRDEQIFAERGEVVSHIDNAPVETDVFHVRLFWLSARPLKVGDSVTLKIGPAAVRATIKQIERVIDVDALTDRSADSVARDEIADIVVRTGQLVTIDPHQDMPRTGRVVFTDRHETLGGGLNVNRRAKVTPILG